MEREYTVIMKRTYETEITVSAKSKADAIAMVEADESRFAEELEQCNVITETYKATIEK